jgi:hypothetical protein
MVEPALARFEEVVLFPKDYRRLLLIYTRVRLAIK